MCISTQWRAVVSEILPTFWQHHKKGLSADKAQLELIDNDYANRNRGLLLAMERWVQEIERADEKVIQDFFAEFSPNDRFW